MIYFKTKSELKSLEEFRKDVTNFWENKDKLGIRDTSRILSSLNKARQNAENRHIKEELKDEYLVYENLRAKVSKNLPKIIKKTRSLRIPTDVSSLPPPAVGGAIIPQNILMAIINDNTYSGIKKEMILDTIDMAIGECERVLNDEFYKLINPFYWILSLFKLIVRIPFLILQASGFNIEKIEETYVAKFFKLITIVIYILLIYFFGQKINVLDIFKSILSQ